MSESAHIFDIVVRWRQEGLSEAQISQRLQKMGLDANTAAAQMQKVGFVMEAAASEAGTKAGKSYAEKFSHHLTRHLASFAGRFAGIPGVGALVGGFGIGGAAAAVGFGLVEKAIEALVHKHKALAKETAELVQLHKDLRFAGADEKVIQPMTKHVQELARAMGTDLKGAAAVARAELAGDFTELKKLGIVINEDISHSAQLAQAFRRVADAGKRSFSDIERAARIAASEIDGIKTAADAATAALLKTIATIGRVQTARDRASGNKETADIATIEADVAEGLKTREEADKAILELRKKNATDKFSTSTQSDQAKITQFQGAIESERAGMIASGEDIAERERIVALNEKLRQRQGATQQIQSQIDARVESGFGKGKTEAEYRAYLATLPGGVSAEQLTSLDDLSRQRSQSQAGERAIREQLPTGRTNLDFETEALNKLRPGVVQSQNAAYARIVAHMEKIAELEESIAGAGKDLTEDMRKLEADARKSKRENLQRRADDFASTLKDDPKAKLPPELRGLGIQFTKDGKAILPPPAPAPSHKVPFDIPAGWLNQNQRPADHFESEPHARPGVPKRTKWMYGPNEPREHSGSEPAPYAEPAVKAANNLGAATQSGFQAVARVLDEHTDAIRKITAKVGSTAPRTYSP